MAELVPKIGSARFDSRGELRLAERLRDLLEDNAWVWHNLPVGPRGRHPDFLILHPANGLLILEAKDWRLDSILDANKLEVELATMRGQVRTQNPFEQARRYMFDVVRTIESDNQLTYPAGHSLSGRPFVRFGYGAAFTNITRKQFQSTNLREVFPPDRCVFKDEMSETVDAEEFRSRLWSMVSRQSEKPLTLPQFDRLRALIFPEVRIKQIALPLERVSESPALDRTLAVMDMYQEQVARSLGEGHRILRGVAGSGKTLILAFRAEYLARAAAKPVLILCYANAIAGRLEDAMQERGVEDRVQVSTFHAWCYRMLKAYDIPAPSDQDYPVYEERLAATVKAVARAVERGHIPAAQYDAILIDEAHDFEPDWFLLAVKMVDTRTNALMIAYDDMQAIYKGRERPVWKRLGIEASGRTRVLKVNYRNTSQILAFAKRFAADIMNVPGVAADSEDPILMPEDAGRQGVEPEIRRCVSTDGEAHAIAEWLHTRRRAGYEWAEMAVVYPEHWFGKQVASVLERSGIPVDVAKDNRNKISVSRSAVRMLTMHSAKGLEFPCVAVSGLGLVGRHGELIEDCVRLAYVAITRATHEAFLTYSNDSMLIQRLTA